MHPTTTYVRYTPISTEIWGVSLLSSSYLPTAISCFSPSTHEWTLADTHHAPTSQPSSGSPSTSSYNLGTSQRTTPSYAPYRLLPQNNMYFPFPRPPQLVAPPQGKPHVGVKFVQPSPIQQFHTFE
jgi:hypothetical protein